MHELNQRGQFVWLDHISRSLITGGGLQRLIEDDGLGGVTSNPTSFDKAIAGSTDYDAGLHRALNADRNLSNRALAEHLIVEDIQSAADVLRPVYDDSDGANGFVSIEVSPGSAHDTGATVAEARHLWRVVARPNVMIKVPATPEGVPAVEALTAEGINVNITLMFSLGHYEAVAQAYLRGIDRHPNPHQVTSVASLFVSRLDVVADRMLEEIGDIKNIPDFIKKVKSGEANTKLMGFGHRVYKSYDPRAKVIKRIADLVFAVTGKNPLLEIALELERIALEDDYFVTRKLYPNVDFYSGLIYQAMGFPVEMFPVLFAIPRTAGWIAQWEEMLLDSEQKIARPRQIYTGVRNRPYVTRHQR